MVLMYYMYDKYNFLQWTLKVSIDKLGSNACVEGGILESPISISDVGALEFLFTVFEIFEVRH